MNNTNSKLSATRISRIREQGYFNYSDGEIIDLAWGNRFAYILCTSILIFAIGTANITLLTIMTIIAFGGFALPNHPFDYIYNYGIRGIIKKPKLPRRSKQLKFACGTATLWLAAIIYLFSSGNTLAAYILGVVFVSIATLVSTIDLCIPSIVYNAIFKVPLPSGENS